MATLLTFRVFMWKALKEKQFSWKFVLIFVYLLPCLVTGLLLFSSHSERSISTQEFDALDTVRETHPYFFANNTLNFFPYLSLEQETLATYFPGGVHDSVCFTPDTPFFSDLIERVRFKLGILYESEFLKICQSPWKIFNFSPHLQESMVFPL